MGKIRFLALVMALAMVLCSVPALAAEAGTHRADAGGETWLVPRKKGAPAFSDVPANHPFAAAVATACEAGLLEGYPDGSFRPGGTLTNAQLTAAASRLSNLLAGGDGMIPLVYDDAPWYQGYYQYLAPVLGFSDWQAMTQAVRPDTSGSRSGFAELLSAVLDQAGLTLPARNAVTCIPDAAPGSITGQLDGLTPKKDCYAAVLGFYNAGILQGVDAWGTLDDRAVTRGQAAAMLARLIDPAQRLTFTLKPFDLCRDVLGLAPETAVAFADGVPVTAEQFCYAFAVRFTSAILLREDGSFTPLAEALPESAENALAFLARESCAARLGVKHGYAPSPEETAALEKEAAEKAGCGGLSQQSWLYELEQTAAVNAAYDYYEKTYGATQSPLFQIDGGGEAHFLDDLNDPAQSVSWTAAPALSGMDWAAAAARIAASPYAHQEILSRPRLCGWTISA
ncbi:MAG: S-layer homology domain-containing protein [Oscillibacter sp.]|nr:S-layer homology domain-containing protein [Oscillibacter sp.]